MSSTPLRSEVAKHAPFDQIRYAQSWEDPESIRRAIRPNASSRILSIAAAGDNSFALLIHGAGSVVSIDMSPAQCALVELKRAAVLSLTYDQLLRFVGAAPARDRMTLYSRVRRELPLNARSWWDSRPTLIKGGVIHQGKLEGMWRTFRTRVHPFIHSRSATRSVFEHRTRLEREEFWQERWNNHRWRLGLRLFFNERVISKLGRDPSFFEHVQIDVGAHYAARAWHAFVELDPATNPFLQYMLLGHYADLEHGHPWLAPQHNATLRKRLGALVVVNEELETHLAECETGSYSGFNLSDVFEWMSDDLHDRVYRSILRAAAPGATIAYWNNLVPRSAPADLIANGTVSPDRTAAEAIYADDRAFLYRDFHVDRVSATFGDLA